MDAIADPAYSDSGELIGTSVDLSFGSPRDIPQMQLIDFRIVDAKPLSTPYLARITNVQTISVLVALDGSLLSVYPKPELTTRVVTPGYVDADGQLVKPVLDESPRVGVTPIGPLPSLPPLPDTGE